MDKVVKSAERVLRTFEYLAEQRRPVRVSDVSRELRIPQSSTSQLLQSLVSLGYLYREPRGRTYSPTLRVSVLGDWLVQRDSESQSPLRLMHAIRRVTGDAVVLGIQNNTHALYISVLEAMGPLRFYMKPGSLRPLCRTAIGLALLLEKTDAEIRLLVRRINAERRTDEPLEETASVLEAVGRSRKIGYVVTHGKATSGAGVVAVPLPPVEAQPRMALGIGAPLVRIDRYAEAYGELLKDMATERWRPASYYGIAHNDEGGRR